MNNKVQVNQTLLRILYYRYRDYVIPGIIFITTWLLFFIIVFPQIQSFLAQKDVAAANEQTLAVMTQNYNIIANVDTTQLQKQLDIATTALPVAKDFAGILTAVSNAAGQSGVILNDYTFQIGSLSSKSTKQDESEVKITLTVNANLDQTKRFLMALSNQFPLSETTDISILSNNIAEINASFFYNALPTISFDPGTPIVPLNSTEKAMLTTLKTNQNTLLAPLIPTVTPTVIPTIVQSFTPTPKVTPTGVPTATISSSSAH